MYQVFLLEGNMNFILIENVKEKESIIFENSFENLPFERLPSDTTAFTYYQQDNIDKNGMVTSSEYRIGVPIEFIGGGEYIELESTLDGFPNNTIYCLYIYDEKKYHNLLKE